MKVIGKDISKSYFRETKEANYFHAVEKTDFELEQGKITEIMGRSGSGKSTLLNIMSGLLAPSEGNVFLGDTDLYSLNDKKLSKLRNENFGIIPQGHTGIASLNTLENILLPVLLYKKASEETTQRANRLIETVGLKGLEKAYELLFGSNGKGGMAKEKPNNNNVVIFLSDGAPDSSDSTSERNKYIANLKSKGAVTYSIGYGEIEKGDTAYNVLLSVSNNIEDNTYIASVSGISDVFDDINGRVNNTGSSTTSKGVAKISENITVDVNHPIEITVNGELKHTFTTIKAAIDSKIIVKESDNSYNIDATKFNPGDKIVISYYNLNN